MFFDSLCRYIAVCEPLRYHAIMTGARLHSCLALAWSVVVLLIALLFIFHMNSPLCGNIIQHVYCSNRGILNLACGPTPLNNIYGQCIAANASPAVFTILNQQNNAVCSVCFCRSLHELVFEYQHLPHHFFLLHQNPSCLCETGRGRQRDAQ